MFMFVSYPLVGGRVHPALLSTCTEPSIYDSRRYESARPISFDEFPLLVCKTGSEPYTPVSISDATIQMDHNAVVPIHNRLTGPFSADDGMRRAPERPSDR